MKAVILCAGEGTRLRPLTHTGAKHLLPVANRPILFHVLDDLAQAGIDEACVIVGEGAQDIRAALGGGENWGIRITYAVQEFPQGLAHAVRVAESFVSDDRFLVYLGDNLFEAGVTDFVEAHAQTNCAAAVLLAPVPDPERFGVASLDEGGRLTAVVEKPTDPSSNLILTGLYMFDPVIFDAISAIRPSSRGELEITDAIQHLIGGGKEVASQELKGWWRDTGKPEDVLDVNRLLLEALPLAKATDPNSVDCRIEGRVFLEGGVEVKDSLIRGPSVVGANCRIENSFVGPFTSIGDRCELIDVEVENSIVMPECRIQGVPFRIDSSILGSQVLMQRVEARPSRNRLILGDHSQIWLS